MSDRKLREAEGRVTRPRSGGRLGIAGIIAAGVLGACGAPPGPAQPQAIASAGGHRRQTAPAPASEASQDERLAAIQKAMNELDEAAQQCWALAATDRFDIEGELAVQIDIAPAGSQVEIVRDGVHNAALVDCVKKLLAAYRFAPPLHGQAIQLPFKFRAPDGQNTIDRSLVPWHGQGSGAGAISVAVLLDESNSGNDAASMLEVAIAAGGATGPRRADRAELWYFLADAQVEMVDDGRGNHLMPSPVVKPLRAGDMMYVPRGVVRNVLGAAGAEVHAVLILTPGGREGVARAGALPTPEDKLSSSDHKPLILPADKAVQDGRATVYAKPETLRNSFMAAVVTVPAGGKIFEHVHAGDTEMLYLLSGSGTLTVDGVDLPLTATSVVQIPRSTRHAIAATSDIRALQVLLHPGPSGSRP
jgi:quercetin dioxygenase-like cupin family protein